MSRESLICWRKLPMSGFTIKDIDSTLNIFKCGLIVSLSNGRGNLLIISGMWKDKLSVNSAIKLLNIFTLPVLLAMALSALTPLCPCPIQKYLRNISFLLGLPIEGKVKKKIEKVHQKSTLRYSWSQTKENFTIMVSWLLDHGVLMLAKLRRIENLKEKYSENESKDN